MSEDRHKDRCTPEVPDPNAKRGHGYRYGERGNRCGNCGRLSEFQDKITKALKAPIMFLFAIFFSLGAWSIGNVMMAGYRDREINFLRIEGTSVVDTADQEDNIDLSNYGVSMGSFMGMRIWKVELGTRGIDDLITSVTDTSTVTLRTLTTPSGSPVNFNADGVIAQWKHSTYITTTIASDAHYGVVFPRGLLIVSDRLYLNVDNEFGITVLGQARIWFTLEKMSESDWREAWEVWRRA